MNVLWSVLELTWQAFGAWLVALLTLLLGGCVTLGWRAQADDARARIEPRIELKWGTQVSVGLPGWIEATGKAEAEGGAAER